MTLGNVFLILFIFLLLGARPARRISWSQPDMYWYNSCLLRDEKGTSQEEMGKNQAAMGNEQKAMRNSQKETGKMNILEHTDQGATIQLDQRELLLVMALVQEGRESFGCNTESGRALDEFFSSANRLVEEARRNHLRQPVLRPYFTAI